MSDWLELELADQLSPVEAPAELWERIARPRPRPAASYRRLQLAVAAGLLIAAVAAGSLWLATPRLDLRGMAAEELGGGGRLEFRSTDPGAINRWLRAQTGLDAAIPATSVQLEGARVIQRHGVLVGAVAYRADSQDALLLVASAGCVRAENRHGQLLWKSHGLAFALACTNPNEPKAACRLCHANL